MSTPAAAPSFEAPRVGVLPSGRRDAITDIGRVRVGHHTLARGDLQTGVTVVLPHGGDPFRDKVPAAATVINGFGKSTGLIQVEELGVLETPIGLTNTFGVGTVANAQIRQAVARNPEIGRSWPTVNPLVFECNDGYLNDIQAMAVAEPHYDLACADASETPAQGAVGAGRGMSSFSLKGGIGTASRACTLVGAGAHAVGALVLANFGRAPNLLVAGRPLGRELAALRTGAARSDSAGADQAGTPEKGSIIILLATDAPLDARQLRRLSLRAAAGLARTGSVFGHGSGDISLAFTTAYTVPHDAARNKAPPALVHESAIDPLFEAAAEATEQAIVNALWSAQTVVGRDGHIRYSLTERLPGWRDLLA